MAHPALVKGCQVPAAQAVGCRVPAGSQETPGRSQSARPRARRPSALEPQPQARATVKHGAQSAASAGQAPQEPARVEQWGRQGTKGESTETPAESHLPSRLLRFGRAPPRPSISLSMSFLFFWEEHRRNTRSIKFFKRPSPRLGRPLHPCPPPSTGGQCPDEGGTQGAVGPAAPIAAAHRRRGGKRDEV